MFAVRLGELGAGTLGLDGDEHVGALHEGDGGLADLEAELLDGGVGDGAGDGEAVLGGDGHVAVDGALLNLGDVAAELVAGRDLQALMFLPGATSMATTALTAPFSTETTVPANWLRAEIFMVCVLSMVAGGGVARAAPG